MKIGSQLRNWHYWVSIGIALPALVMMASGLLLQLKKQWDWVQPPEQRGTGTAPVIGLEALKDRLVATPELGVRGWEQIHRIDVRPSRGVAKVSLTDGWEVQVDLGTGAVLQRAYRRSDLIESIHDGSFFGGDAVKLGVFLPTGLLLLFLLLSGLYLFALPYLAKARRRRRASEPAPHRAD
jgi:uncharacterized iron-regulated membrane protein